MILGLNNADQFQYHCARLGDGFYRIDPGHVGATCKAEACHVGQFSAVALLLVVASASLGGAIFTEAALSYLGLGVPPPNPSWGNMLGGILVASFKPPWWLVVFPGFAITLTILAFNLFGDALRDHLDPRLRGRLD